MQVQPKAPPSECAASVAPQPCSAFTIPDDYKAKRCKYCRVMSFQQSPLPAGAFPSWDPIVPWGQGRKERPAGLVCRLCLIVFKEGGWAYECSPSDLSGFDKLLANDPTRMHPLMAQRAKYVDLRTANPQLRLRSDTQLGPRTEVNVKQRQRSSLEMPEEWFCELSVYKKSNPDKKIEDSDKVWEHINGQWVEGVNVRTGAAGWFKRKKTTEKEVEMTINVHDGDATLSEEIPQAVFAGTQKDVLPSNDAIDALELPFFMMGNHPNRLGLAMSSASSTTAPQPPHDRELLSIANEANPGNPECDGKNVVSDDDDEKETTFNPFSVLAANLNMRSTKGRLAAAKSAPAQQVAPKQTTRPSTKAAAKSTSSAKRKKSADEQEPALIVRLPSDTKKSRKEEDAADGGKATDSQKQSTADMQIQQDYQQQLEAKQKSLFSKTTGTEAAINDGLRSAQKELQTFCGSIKNKIKSLTRRKDKGHELQAALNAIIEDVQHVLSLCQQLIGMTCDDSEPSIVESLKTLGKTWSLADGVFQRGYKCMALSSLKFSDWELLSSVCQQVMNHFGEEKGCSVVQLLISDLVQRLLRALSMKGTNGPSSWTEETLMPLTSFAHHMSNAFKSMPMAETLDLMSKILSPDKHMPSTVLDAICLLQEKGSADTSSSSGDSLAAIITGLAQGKSILRMSRDRAVETKKDSSHLEDVSLQLVEIEKYSSGHDDDSDASSFDFGKAFLACKDICEAIKNALPKSSTDASKSFITEAKKKTTDLVGDMCRTFLIGPVKSWFVVSAGTFKTLKNVGTLPANIMDFCKTIATLKMISKDAADLCQIVIAAQTMINEIASISKGSRECEAKDVVHVLTQIEKFESTTMPILKMRGLLSEEFEAAISEMKSEMESMVSAQVQQDAQKFIRKAGDITAKVLQPDSISTDELSEIRQSCEQLMLLSTRSSSSMDLKLAQLCKFLVVSSTSRGDANAKPDCRMSLRRFIQSHICLQDALKERAKVSGQPLETETQTSIASLRKMLCQSSSFESSFPASDDFVKFYDVMFKNAMSLLDQRRLFYQKDGQQTIDKIIGIQKSLPSLNPEDSTDFITAVKKHEKELLDLCDMAASISASVEKELCQEHTRAMTTLAEHSGAVLLAFPAVKKLKSQGSKATGRIKDLLTTLVANCRDKNLTPNADQHAQITALL